MVLRKLLHGWRLLPSILMFSQLQNQICKEQPDSSISSLKKVSCSQLVLVNYQRWECSKLWHEPQFHKVQLLKQCDSSVRNAASDHFFSMTCGSDSFWDCKSSTSMSTSTLNWGSGSCRNTKRTCKNNSTTGNWYHKPISHLQHSSKINILVSC